MDTLGTKDQMRVAQKEDNDIGPIVRAKLRHTYRPTWPEMSPQSHVTKAYMGNGTY